MHLLRSVPATRRGPSLLVNGSPVKPLCACSWTQRSFSAFCAASPHGRRRAATVCGRMMDDGSASTVAAAGPVDVAAAAVAEEQVIWGWRG